MPTVVANGVRLHYEEQGSGDAVLVIPGIPAIVSDCVPLMEMLSGSFRVVAYDNRGSGDSGKPDAPYSVALFADDAAALLDALGIERAHVIGFSMGGMVAQELALRHPKRVGRLVLGCTHAGFRHGTPPGPEAARAFQIETDVWAERIRALAPFAFAPGYAEREPEAFEAFVGKKTADEQPDYAYRRQLAASLGHDALDRLPDIQHPTLVLTGADDQVVPPQNSERLVDVIADAALVVIPSAGHLFFAEQPGATRKALLEFLSP